jgi:hypothetical protein
MEIQKISIGLRFLSVICPGSRETKDFKHKNEKQHRHGMQNYAKLIVLQKRTTNVCYKRPHRFLMSIKGSVRIATRIKRGSSVIRWFFLLDGALLLLMVVIVVVRKLRLCAVAALYR